MSDEDLRSLGLEGLEGQEAPSAELDARVRRLAAGELALATGPRWRAVAARATTRVVVPGAIVVTVAGYLHWALSVASALQH